MTQELCSIVGMVSAYLDKHPDGERRLKAFLEDDNLWSITDVMTYTGWGRTYIWTLCKAGVLPYIPGGNGKKRFIPAEVKAALADMQTGGKYGRRKTKTKAQR